MTNKLNRIIFAAALLCLTATRAGAEEIIWDQPSSSAPARAPAPTYHQNLHFEGNSTMHRSDVRKMQQALAARGFYKAKIDGIWGGKTTQAILDYQAVHEQPLTGTVTVDTLRDLGVYVDERKY